MRGKRAWMVAVAIFLLGAAVGVAGSKMKATAAAYSGKAPAEAAQALLQTAEGLAEGGSWELIFVGRAHYLAGHQAEGQALFDRVLGRKAEAGDCIRVGRVYWEAGEWDKARAMFDKVVTMAPRDADWLAEIGSYYNLKGDRARAEELFGRSLAEDAVNVYNTTKIAGSYTGVVPD